MKLIYFHGGGFLSGNKDDLPNKIKDFFLNLGYEIIVLDYPLAPKIKLDDIIDWCVQNIPDSEDLVYFGRSAGGFLAFACAQHKKPKAIIDFYGYARLDKEWMNHNPYNNIPLVTKDTFEQLINNGTKDRYSVYIYARQNRAWFEMLNTKEMIINLDKTTPTFIWHSLFDPDVPYKEAKHIHENLEHSVLKTSFIKKHEIDLEIFDQIKDSLHDFLKNIN